MRAVLQRVSRAGVAIEGRTTASIGPGLMILLAVMEGDTAADAALLAGKIAQMRIFSDGDGKMNLSVEQIGGQALVVSNFTLGAAWRHGRRPSFVRAARPETAEPLYERFVQELKGYALSDVQIGRFGADMEVELVNDGPVTIFMDSRTEE